MRRKLATIDNAWFPLIPGTSWTYQGVKDGEKAIDAVTVTRDTKMVARWWTLPLKTSARRRQSLMLSSKDQSAGEFATSSTARDVL